MATAESFSMNSSSSLRKLSSPDEGMMMVERLLPVTAQGHGRHTSVVSF